MNTFHHRFGRLVAGTVDGLRRGRVMALVTAAAVLAVATGIGWGLASAGEPTPDSLDTPPLAGSASSSGSPSGSDLERSASPGSPDDGGVPTGGTGSSGGAGTSGQGDTGGGAGQDGDDDPAPGPGPDPDPDPDPEPSPDPGPAEEPAELERVLLLPVDLVAPVGCFTEGLPRRYVDGYGAQSVDSRPHGELLTTTVEYDELTRLPMSSTERRVHVLPGSGRAAQAQAGSWTVEVDVHVFLSGGFKIDYARTHHGETGQFRQQFTSSVDSTCTVELVYGITTSPVQ